MYHHSLGILLVQQDSLHSLEPLPPLFDVVVHMSPLFLSHFSHHVTLDLHFLLQLINLPIYYPTSYCFNGPEFNLFLLDLHLLDYSLITFKSAARSEYLWLDVSNFREQIWTYCFFLSTSSLESLSFSIRAVYLLS
jgi:hypothetical protein